MSAPSSPHSAPASVVASKSDVLDSSCRLPLVTIFGAASLWLFLASGFALIGSIKFHSPGFLADSSILTYGHVRPAFVNCLLYGFCIPAGLGVALWLFVRLSRTPLVQPWLIVIGAKLWNLGVLIGVGAILLGDSTGFEDLEMPHYAALIIFIGYLMISFWGVLTLHERRERALFPSQWFLLAAIFWFPWIYATAQLLLVQFPVRGVLQPVIAWWYSNNLRVVWLELVGLATAFYFVPALSGRPLQSRYLALFCFWTLLIFSSWGGIPPSAPVPAWMPAISTVTTVLSLFTYLAVVITARKTLGPLSNACSHPSLMFVITGVALLALFGLANAAAAVPQVNRMVAFTWFTPAQAQLGTYGFFTMTMLGAIYYITPRVIGVEVHCPKLVRAHFWCMLVGVLLAVVPLAAGGVAQGFKLLDPAIPFAEVVKSTLPFLRVSTVGDLLIVAGNLLFIWNLGGLALQFYRARAVSVYAEATADLFAEAKS